MELTKRLALETPLPNLETMKNHIKVVATARGENKDMVERAFYKTPFHTQLKAGIRQRPTEIRSSKAWARGFIAHTEHFNNAAEAGIDGFHERLLATAPHIHPLNLFFGLSPTTAATWTDETISEVIPNPLLKRASAFVQTVSDFNMPFDYFARLMEVRPDYTSGQIMTLLKMNPSDSLRQVFTQLATVKGPRRDALAWFSLGSSRFSSTDLIHAIPLLVAVGCSPAEAYRLRELGVTSAMDCVRIVGHNVPDEYVTTHTTGDSAYVPV